MKISEIYERYQVPKNLQQHMLQVAAVGALVAHLIKDAVPLDKDTVIKTLLLHDMANIVKFSFDGKVAVEEGVEHLKEVQKNIISKYGSDEHLATLAIAKELQMPENVIDILANTGSPKIHLTIHSDDWYEKVCSYADFRVSPYGIVSINERFDDVLKRYKGREHALADIQKTEEKTQNCLILESQIQAKTRSLLRKITDSEIEPIAKELLDYGM